MERKNFAGWLFISLLPLFVFIWMTMAHHQALQASAPIAVDQVSAELARTISYGFVQQPVDEALGCAFDNDAVAPGRASAALSQHTLYCQTAGLGASALKS